MKIFHTLTEIL